ncbi:sorting nexin-16 isoform X3 [Phyllopteryx taeniolatus]|uniref:sorting nexin-16 isoform X3 n=1 Tax=Phyllopteryx taeniolatus TaxID=161469 RepID=UPI002AD3C97F|nr:sorting nexin-16 isoform X3 [Phyllopteryx taeniolatus]
MASPFVPVPIPLDRVSSSVSNKLKRPPRASSLGSVSSSSELSSPITRSAVDEHGRCRSSQFQSRCTDRSSRSQTPPPQRSPVMHTRGNGTFEPSVEYSSCPRSISAPIASQQGGGGERPITPTVLGYEVMEERAKFTVYKVLVRKTTDESWVVFRRYADFSRLNDKAFCETLEESNYRLQKELLEKQQEIASLKRSLQEKEQAILLMEKHINGECGMPQSPCGLSTQGSESSADADVESSSAAEADQDIPNEPGAAGVLEPIPAIIGQEGGVHPELVASQSQGIYKQTTIHTHIHTYGQFRVSNSCMFLGCGKKPEYLEKTHAGTGKTCKLHTGGAGD